jgi:hypothetical protein
VHAEEVVLTRTHVGLVMEYVKGARWPLCRGDLGRAVALPAPGSTARRRAGTDALPHARSSSPATAGGNMVGYVTRQRETRDQRGGLCLDEDECNYFFRQLIWAVQFCHENHVAHRWVPRALLR